MKTRHQPVQTSRRSWQKAAAKLETAKNKSAPASLKNLELRRSARGQFLVFKTSDGGKFTLNLDVQEEFGFEAKQLLEQWAREQRLERAS